MHIPDKYELEFAALFLLSIPSAYWMLRTVLAFLGIG